MNKITVRNIAYKILTKVLIEDAYSNITINYYFNKNELDNRDKSYISELVYGTIKNKIYLEKIVKEFTNSRVKNKVKVLLIMSVYQIIFMDKSPNFAVVNESVEIAKKEFGTYTSKFVNAILRNIITNFNRDHIKYQNNLEKFLIENSCPKELFDILKQQYGETKAKSIVLSFNLKSEHSIRVNPLKISKQELKDYFTSKNINIADSSITKDCLLLEKLDLSDDYFKNGYYIVQDEASALVAHTILEKTDAYYDILDVCAAPGGKSLHTASLYFNSNLTACDKYIHKLKLIEDNAKKLSVKNISILEQDATKINSNFIEKFDIVICDVPCSGIGVIKNKAEIKYKITNDGIEDIVKLQAIILDNASKYLKKGGILIYSTCTIDKRENEYTIDKFLANNKNYKLEKIKLNDSIINEYREGMINILPDEYNCDGFFIARLRKMENIC